MNKKEFETVLQFPADVRYEYFIREVVNREKIWGLYNNSWAMTKDEDGEILIPLWPRKEFAEHCLTDAWETYSAKSIDLYEFLKDWVEWMKTDGYKPSIFWLDGESAVVDIDICVKNIQNEFEKY